MKNIFVQIRALVRKIPKGKVSTYGEIAKAVGTRDNRLVGWAVYGNRDPKVPCHRVVKKDGFIAEGYSLGGSQWQKRRLEAEGVKFIKPNQVDLKKYLWKIKNLRISTEGDTRK
jgi:methylated-DNA-protein-cysteine methyltransferase-like protein